MALLSLSLFFLSLLLGYTFPKKALYFSIITFPLLYPVNFTIVPSEIIFLNINRVVFAMIVGIHLKYGKKLQLNLILKNGWIKIFLVFSLYVVLISLDDRAKNIIFAYVPYQYTALVLGFLIIRSEKNFKWLVKILTWQSGFFSLVVLLEFFHIIDLMLIVKELRPTFNLTMIQEGFRGSIFRVPGWDGQPILSAVRLVILFPITLLNLKWTKNKLLNFIFPMLSFVSILLLMSRAAYLALAVSLIFLYYFVIVKVNKNVLQKLLFFMRNILVVFIIFISIVIYVPFLRNVVTNIYYFSTSIKTAEDTDTRAARLPYAMEQFKKKPILGYGSPQYAYFVIMNARDIPATVLYLLAGGIPLFILFVSWLLWMPFYFLKYLRYKFITKNDKIIIIYISSAFVGGIIPMFINITESSLLLMLIMFTATYKYFIIRRSNSLNNNLNY